MFLNIRTNISLIGHSTKHFGKFLHRQCKKTSDFPFSRKSLIFVNSALRRATTAIGTPRVEYTYII